MDVGELVEHGEALGAARVRRVFVRVAGEARVRPLGLQPVRGKPLRAVAAVVQRAAYRPLAEPRDPAKSHRVRAKRVVACANHPVAPLPLASQRPEERRGNGVVLVGACAPRYRRERMLQELVRHRRRAALVHLRLFANRAKHRIPHGTVGLLARNKDIRVSGETQVEKAAIHKFGAGSLAPWRRIEEIGVVLLLPCRVVELRGGVGAESKIVLAPLLETLHALCRILHRPVVCAASAREPLARLVLATKPAEDARCLREDAGGEIRALRVLRPRIVALVVEFDSLDKVRVALRFRAVPYAAIFLLKSRPNTHRPHRLVDDVGNRVAALRNGKLPVVEVAGLKFVGVEKRLRDVYVRTRIVVARIVVPARGGERARQRLGNGRVEDVDLAVFKRTRKRDDIAHRKPLGRALYVREANRVYRRLHEGPLYLGLLLDCAPSSVDAQLDLAIAFFVRRPYADEEAMPLLVVDARAVGAPELHDSPADVDADVAAKREKFAIPLAARDRVVALHGERDCRALRRVERNRRDKAVLLAVSRHKLAAFLLCRADSLDLEVRARCVAHDLRALRLHLWPRRVRNHFDVLGELTPLVAFPMTACRRDDAVGVAGDALPSTRELRIERNAAPLDVHALRLRLERLFVDARRNLERKRTPDSRD